MITKELSYQKAFEIKRNNLRNKTLKREMLLNAAYALNPRLSEIDREMTAVGSQIVTTTLSGDKDKLNILQAKSHMLANEKKEILHIAQVFELEYDCAFCKDTGYINGKICDCIKKTAANIISEELSKEMPLKQSFHNFDLNYYGNIETLAHRRMTSIYRLCQRYAADFNPQKSRNLLFMGCPGLGKTHLSLAIVSEIINKGYVPFYGPSERLFTLVWNERYANENIGVYQAMINSDLLVIDDLGTESINDFNSSVLYSLINGRLLSKKPTIINTNLTMKEIAQKYGDRIVSRLIGEYDANEFLGQDIRQQKFLQENRGI